MEAKRYLKIFFSVIGVFIVFHVVSMVAFLKVPQVFYYRAWEYFTDIGYRVQGLPIEWTGEESGDLSRDYIFLFRQTWRTRVTADRFGFRSTAKAADSYPVLMAGDSTIFGSGLSDSETLASRLSEILGTPVFNGGRTNVFNALRHPGVGRVEVLIDGMTERSTSPRQLAKDIKLYREGDGRFAPLAKKNETLAGILGEIPLRRYSLPLIGLHGIPRLYNDLESLFTGKGSNERLFYPHRHDREDFQRTVEMIVERRNILSRMVGRYVFLAVPAKQTIYGEDIDPYTRDFIPLLVAALKERGVEAVDLTAALRRESHRNLYFPFDTHMNAKGAAVAAREIAHQVFGRTLGDTRDMR